MTQSANFHILSELDAPARAALLRRSEADLSGFIEKVRPIIEAVRLEGDAALLRFGQNLDGARGLTRAGLKVSAAEFDAAFAAVSAEITAAIGFGIANIRSFHQEQAPAPMWLKEIRPGAFAGDRFTPIRSVALYVPRGKGSFPSVTMMTTGPAVVAGVPEIAIFTPPAPDGTVDAATLVAARLAGVETVYKVGGAQAVAAAAYGTETVRPALKIVGPDSAAYLVTHSRRVAVQALAALPGHWAMMTELRVGFSRAVLCGPCGGVILTGSAAESYAFINDFAPEHLEILSTAPFEHLGHITEAAEILLGPHTPVSIANFGLGPNAVLPTSRGARTFGPLSVSDFVKRSSIGYVTAPAYPAFADQARKLALYEGFSSHANAVSPLRDAYLNQA